jgi:hypothetical protein
MADAGVAGEETRVLKVGQPWQLGHFFVFFFLP